jgi:hypothetical protein
MNIYCNGDSFTAGEELLDYQFAGWPGYRAMGSILVKDTDHQWGAVRRKIGSTIFGSIEYYLEKQKEQSWAGQLNKINNSISVINGAIGGSTITGIANRTIADLAKYRDKKFDFVFIQLTSPNRLGFYNSTLPETYFMKEHPIGHIDKFPPLEQEIAKKYILCYSDKEFAIQYLYTVVGLKHAIYGLTGQHPIFLSSHKIWKDYITIPLLKDQTLYNNEIIKILIEESGILTILDSDIMEDIQTKNNFLHTPGLHFEPRCHKEFAKVIYNKYIDKNRC